ncbi:MULTISPECIES: hypothetical protein [Hydrocarboniphaga]|uniref:hypothetical protein n=1 Tax=Hydrocarboniphaga TaxID=243627 RepID=UPI0012F8EA9A|nr:MULTISPECIES: hypothetical protein [Hydrocarboniphaga]MDZ4077075.1 hypothetical protein [Hydrocarboniphaga sp.]
MHHLKSCLFLLGSVLPFSCVAAVYQGYISNISASNGKIYIVLSDGGFQGGNSGSCPLSPSTMSFSIDPNTAIGRAQISLALTAYSAKSLVWTTGDGICATGSIYGAAAEGLSYIDLKT